MPDVDSPDRCILIDSLQEKDRRISLEAGASQTPQAFGLSEQHYAFYLYLDDKVRKDVDTSHNSS